MKTNFIGFRKLYGQRRNNWSGLWSLDGRELTDAEARIFVDRAIAAGYTYDEDVPEDKIREWIGWTNRKGDAKWTV